MNMLVVLLNFIHSQNCTVTKCPSIWNYYVETSQNSRLFLTLTCAEQFFLKTRPLIFWSPKKALTIPAWRCSVPLLITSLCFSSNAPFKSTGNLTNEQWSEQGGCSYCTTHPVPSTCPVPQWCTSLSPFLTLNQQALFPKLHKSSTHNMLGYRYTVRTRIPLKGCEHKPVKF